MKQSFILLLATVLLSSCIKVNFEEDFGTDKGGNTDSTSTVISGKISTNRTYKQGKYTLRGYVYVTEGATLTFDPGCVIVSDNTEKGAIIIERGAKLIAEGSPNQPIVFTSGKPAGSRAPGDWGGIILLGKAPTNRPQSPEPVIEGGVNRGYGGTNAADNSGALRYVRIEYAGIAAEPGSEINGLTCGGVGSGTVIDHVQVSYGNDDAYEFFGGTVNAKYLIALATMDDDFDFDFGYNGKIQYGISLRAKPSDTDQANGIECDNDGSGTSATPFTKPMLSNFTLIGPYDTTGSSTLHGFGNRWRRSTRFVLRNSIMIGHKLGGFVMEGDGTINGYINGESEFKNNLLHAYKKVYSSQNQTLLTDAALLTKIQADGTVVLAAREDALLENPFNLTSPNFLPKATSPALTAGSFTGLDNFFKVETFKGAMGTTDWTTGWSSFNPQANSY
jgi:hypothetical protein